MKTSEVLYRAADIIECRGWGRGELSMYGIGGFCIYGAIYAALHQGRALPWQPPDLDRLRIAKAYAEVECSGAGRAVRRHLAPYGWTPPPWNDNVARTTAEVLGVLRECAAAAEEWEREAAEVATTAAERHDLIAPRFTIPAPVVIPAPVASVDRELVPT